jgi:hypothetical protein
MSGVKKSFKLQYIIHSETKSINLNLEDKISSMNSVVMNTYRMKMDDYEIIYKNTRVGNYDKTFKDIVGNDTNPIFTYNKIPKVKEAKVTNTKQLKANPQSGKLISYSKVSVENYPSRPELIDHLDKFLSGSKEYSLHNADSVVEIIFKNSVFVCINK